MNIKYILSIISCYLSFSTVVLAQVGINTNTPKAPLHIDAQGNTESSSIIEDDVVITEEGYLGIGTLTPQTRLEVNGNVIVSGTSEVKGDLQSNVISAKGLRINKPDLTGAESILEVYADSLGKALKLEDGTNTINNVPSMRFVPVMQEKADDPGVMQWVNLPLVTKTITGTIAVGTAISTNYINVGSPLALDEAGRWIIFTSFAVDNRNGVTNTNRSNVFVSLFNVTGGANIEMTRTASPTESAGWSVSIPQLIHLVEIASPITVQVRAKSLIGSANYTVDGAFGRPQLFAVKID